MSTVPVLLEDPLLPGLQVINASNPTILITRFTLAFWFLSDVFDLMVFPPSF
jgi:hypothetical protein